MWLKKGYQLATANKEGLVQDFAGDRPIYPWRQLSLNVHCWRPIGLAPGTSISDMATIKQRDTEQLGDIGIDGM